MLPPLRPIALAMLAAPLALAGERPSFPLATDLKKVPVGGRADYEMSIGESPPVRVRWAIVAREGDEVTLETTVRLTDVALTTALVLKDGKVKRRIIQRGGEEPMEVPPSAELPGETFVRPPPRTLVGREIIVVDGAKVEAKRHRLVEGARTVEVWTNDKIAPLGIVRLREQGAAGSLTLDLVAFGKDAMPTIVKSARPFDPTRL